MREEIIVIDKVQDDEQDGKQYKLVTDKAGETHKIKQGRGGSLKAKWPLLEENVGKAIKLKIDQFKGFDFISDFELVSDIFEQEAAQKVTQSPNTKDKSVGLHYSIRLIETDKIELNNALFYAELFYRYMTGAITIPEEIIIRKINSMIRLEVKGEQK